MSSSSIHPNHSYPSSPMGGEAYSEENSNSLSKSASTIPTTGGAFSNPTISQSIVAAAEFAKNSSTCLFSRTIPNNYQLSSSSSSLLSPLIKQTSTSVTRQPSIGGLPSSITTTTTGTGGSFSSEFPSPLSFHNLFLDDNILGIPNTSSSSVFHRYATDILAAPPIWLPSILASMHLPIILVPKKNPYSIDKTTYNQKLIEVLQPSLSSSSSSSGTNTLTPYPVPKSSSIRKGKKSLSVDIVSSSSSVYPLPNPSPTPTRIVSSSGTVPYPDWLPFPGKDNHEKEQTATTTDMYDIAEDTTTSSSSGYGDDILTEMEENIQETLKEENRTVTDNDNEEEENTNEETGNNEDIDSETYITEEWTGILPLPSSTTIAHYPSESKVEPSTNFSPRVTRTGSRRKRARYETDTVEKGYSTSTLPTSGMSTVVSTQTPSGRSNVSSLSAALTYGLATPTPSSGFWSTMGLDALASASPVGSSIAVKRNESYGSLAPSYDNNNQESTVSPNENRDYDRMNTLASISSFMEGEKMLTPLYLPSAHVRSSLLLPSPIMTTVNRNTVTTGFGNASMVPSSSLREQVLRRRYVTERSKYTTTSTSTTTTDPNTPVAFPSGTNYNYTNSSPKV